MRTQLILSLVLLVQAIHASSLRKRIDKTNAVEINCPAGNIEAYFADPDDCNKFYQCANGVPVLQTCPEGLVFNPNLDVCDWPSNYACGSSGSGSDSPVEVNTGSSGDIVCPAGNIEAYFADPDDCNKFYQCSNGVPVLQTCPEGLVFNPNLDVCDWPSNYACGSSGSGSDSPVEVNTGSSGDIVCPAGNIEAYFADPDDCNKFYQCSNGVPVPQTCPEGLVFNPNLDVCDWPSNYACSS